MIEITIGGISVVEWNNGFKATIPSNMGEVYTFEGTLDEVYEQIKEALR